MVQSLARAARRWLRGSTSDRAPSRPTSRARLEVEGLENRELLTGSPFTHLAPGIAVKSISAGVTPGCNTPAVYAVGLDNQVWSVAPSGAQLLTCGQVKSISAAPELVGGTEEVFAVGLDNQVWMTHACSPGHWSAFTLYAPGIAVKSISVGVTPGCNTPAVYAVGLDNQVWSISPTGASLLTHGQVKSISAAPELVNGAEEVFAVGLDNQIWMTHACSPGHWSAFTCYAPGIAVNSISVGVAPGCHVPEVYAVGLDNQVWSIFPTGAQLQTCGQVKSISAAPELVGYGASEVFAVGLDNQIYFTLD